MIVDLVIHFIRYDHGKSIRMFSLYNHKLLGKIEEHVGKKYLLFDNYNPEQVLDRMKI